MKNILLLLITTTIHYSSLSQANSEIIITELLADPLPSAGLPESEFVELKNVSGHTINIRHWYITDGNSKAVIREDCIVESDSFIIICATAFIKEFEWFGRTVGVSGFPSLDNSGDLISLISADGRTIHAVEYQSNWINDPVKALGGWSLEMIDISKPCTLKTNWNVSRAGNGGTPGYENSTTNNISDNYAPAVIHSYFTDSTHVAVVFDKPLDSNAAVNTLLYEISNGIGKPIAASAVAPFFSLVYLELKTPVAVNTIYLLHHEGIADCYGNKSPSLQGIRTGLPDHHPKRLVINEILFNPIGGGVDYVELYNNGQSIIDAAELYISNSAVSGASTSIYKCSATPLLFFPGDYFTLTEDTNWVSNHYRVKIPQSLHTINKLPSFPDDLGEIVILSMAGVTLDAFQYSAQLHFPLISNPEGVALERMDPNVETQLNANWFSASGDAGYGTPAGINSQFRRKGIFEGDLMVSPETFSPDLDGYNDVLTISYSFPHPGFSCSIFIFNSGGHPVKSLVRNQLCGTSGSFRWDGLDEKNNRLFTGLYFLDVEIFDLTGKLKKMRKAVILARQ